MRRTRGTGDEDGGGCRHCCGLLDVNDEDVNNSKEIPSS